MGWTGTHKTKGQSIRDFFALEFGNETDKGKITVIDCSATLNEAYLAMEVIRGGKRTVFALVCLIHHNPKSYYNFSYKDMDETMEPYAYNCPERILDILTPIDNENAIRWREGCRAEIERKNNIPKFDVGDVIEFNKPLKFGRFKIKTMRCINKKPLRFIHNGLSLIVRRATLNQGLFVVHTARNAYWIFLHRLIMRMLLDGEKVVERKRVILDS